MNYKFLPLAFRAHVEGCNTCRSVDSRYWQEARLKIGLLKSLRLSGPQHFHDHFMSLEAAIPRARVELWKSIYDLSISTSAPKDGKKMMENLHLPLVNFWRVGVDAPHLPFSTGDDEKEMRKLRSRVRQLLQRRTSMQAMYSDGISKEEMAMIEKQFEQDLKQLRIDMQYLECQSGLKLGKQLKFSKSEWATVKNELAA